MKTGIFVVACAAMASASALAANVTVYSNLSNAGLGDQFVNFGSSNQGEAVGATGWYYNNVRNFGAVGISSVFARNGNGSANFNGVAFASSKADFEFLSGAVADPSNAGNFVASTSLGRLGDLSALSYEWYRDGISASADHLHPTVRILVDADGNLGTTDDRGGLVFEREYNGGGPAPTDTWVSEDIFAYGAGGANMWTFGAGMANWELGYGIDLSEWQAGAGAIDGDSLVIGFSMGIGSGWSSFLGAVDNFTFGFGGSSTTFNFEVEGAVVPAPLAGVMGAAGLFGVAGIRRRR